MLQNYPLKLPPFHFNADPAFHFDADLDPNPASQNDADPDPQHWACLFHLLYLLLRLSGYIYYHKVYRFLLKYFFIEVRALHEKRLFCLNYFWWDPRIRGIFNGANKMAWVTEITSDTASLV